MKRSTLILFALAFMPLSVFAQYGEVSSPGLPAGLVLLLTIMFVWGVLEMILFFKVWKMTNNVSKITEKYIAKKKSTNAVMKYFAIKALQGEEAAKQYVKEDIINTISEFDTEKYCTRKELENIFEECKANYKYLLDTTGIKFPDTTEVISFISPLEYNGFKVGDKVIKLDPYYYVEEKIEIKGFNVAANKILYIDNDGNAHSCNISECKPETDEQKKKK